jgi:hypothetical protein
MNRRIKNNPMSCSIKIIRKKGIENKLKNNQNFLKYTIDLLNSVNNSPDVIISCVNPKMVLAYARRRNKTQQKMTRIIGPIANLASSLS